MFLFFCWVGFGEWYSPIQSPSKNPKPVCAGLCLSPSFALSLPFTMGGSEEWEAQKAKITGWDKKNLLETANGIRKWTVTVTEHTPHTLTDNRQYQMAPPAMISEPEVTFSPQKSVTFPHPSSDLRWWKITSGSWPSPLLATKKR